MRKLKQATLRLWFDDSIPSKDLPDEEVGIVVGGLGETIEFAGKVIESHWNGECGCQK